MYIAIHMRIGADVRMYSKYVCVRVQVSMYSTAQPQGRVLVSYMQVTHEWCSSCLRVILKSLAFNSCFTNTFVKLTYNSNCVITIIVLSVLQV